MMSALLRLVALLLVLAGTLDAYQMIAAPRGTCVTKRAYGIFRMMKYQCAIMGGGWNGHHGNRDWVDCHIDWCDIPAKGRVASGYVWGLDANQIPRTTSQSRTWSVIKMTRRDCDRLHGRYNGNPKVSDWIDCHLYFTKISGADRKNINTLVLTGVKECGNKLAYGIIRMTNRECLQVGGKWNGNPGANDWIDCHLDVCVSPAIQCKPSDLWSTVQTCRNPSSSTFTCSFELTTGIEKSKSSELSSGGSTSFSITAGVGVELMGIFTASVETSFSTGFEWSKTVGSSQTWSKSTTRSLSVAVDPGKAISIKQVVGKCGDFRVDTTEYRVVNVPLHK